MGMTYRRTALIALIAVAGCTNSGDEMTTRDSRSAGDAATSGAVRDTAGMQGMAGMAGMSDSSMSGMSQEMHAHMLAMAGAAADSMKRMVPTHRQLVANMIAKMNGEMRDMQMTGNSEWSATVDSLRQDLVRLPELSGPELTTMMPAHLARVTRLSAMHQQMMRAMAR